MLGLNIALGFCNGDLNRIVFFFGIPILSVDHLPIKCSYRKFIADIQNSYFTCILNAGLCFDNKVIIMRRN